MSFFSNFQFFYRGRHYFSPSSSFRFHTVNQLNEQKERVWVYFEVRPEVALPTNKDRFLERETISVSLCIYPRWKTSKRRLYPSLGENLRDSGHSFHFG